MHLLDFCNFSNCQEGCLQVNYTFSPRRKGKYRRINITWLDTVTTNTEYTWDISLLDKEIIQHQNFLFYISVGIIPLFKLFLLLILWKSDGSCIHMYFVCISNNTLKISQGFSLLTHINNTKGKKFPIRKRLGW